MQPMSRQPPLSIVSSDTTAPQPPRPLGVHGLKLWNEIQAEYRIDDRGGIEILAQLCAALDRAETLAVQVAEDGLLIATRNGPKAHPLIKEELSARSFICRMLHRLGLNIEIVKPVGRPGSGGTGWTGN
jgi:hypothetical protein